MRYLCARWTDTVKHGDRLLFLELNMFWTFHIELLFKREEFKAECELLLTSSKSTEPNSYESIDAQG